MARRTLTARRRTGRCPCALALLSLLLAGGARGEDEAGAEKLRYRTDWTSKYAPIWQRTLARFRGRPEVAYLEVGIFEGRSTLWMLANVLTHPTSRATGIDIKLGDNLRHNLMAAGQAGRVKLLQGESGELLRTLPLASFDIIYVDASHLARDVLADAVLSWQLLRPEGVMIFDDYGFHMKGSLSIDMRPQIAVDAFLSAYRNELEILHRSYQVIVQRRPAPCRGRCDQCARLTGEHYYSFNIFGNFYRGECRPRGLFRISEGGAEEVVPLSAAEERLVRRMLRGLLPGEVEVRLDRFAGDPAYAGLSRKLAPTVR